ncbi:DUF4239 domain-containing protein [Rhodovastum sp. RN2-1]|uniref:DUF4239 domain-containing protein n=1 Tax=Limobrevibacterium gyesilva TaxID=2991712 RepID=A0AA41YML4_9PROT|nr:DUF4239 domain-containing protein [Limobrevibacterium gyesilva]
MKLVMGLVATMSALVLGLLIASAKTTSDTQSTEVVQLSAGIIELDRLLARYGPETAEARAALRDAVAAAVDRVFNKGDARPIGVVQNTGSSSFDNFSNGIVRLSPQNDTQRFLRGQILQLGSELGHTRLLMYGQRGSSIKWPFLVVLIFWLVILFWGFGMLSPANPTVVAALLIGALSVAGAVFLILELDNPYSGLMRISSEPARDALAVIGH